MTTNVIIRTNGEYLYRSRRWYEFEVCFGYCEIRVGGGYKISLTSVLPSCSRRRGRMSNLQPHGRSISSLAFQKDHWGGKTCAWNGSAAHQSSSVMRFHCPACHSNTQASMIGLDLASIPPPSMHSITCFTSRERCSQFHTLAFR